MIIYLNKNIIFFTAVLFTAIIFLYGCGKYQKPEVKEITLLNVSYDPTREFYRDFNKAFARDWKKKHGVTVKINQSHGGSGKQARSVIEGLDADVVTLALAYDVDEISKRGIIDKGWETELPFNSSPYTSVIVFLVRKGNPKNIKDWDDLIRWDVSVITPNPKTSGGARWNYLAAWAYANRKFNGNENKIKHFISRLLSNVPVYDMGARGSANTFVQREMGDVLISWENEAILIKEDVSSEYEIIYPSLTMLAEPPVAVVDKVVSRKGTKDISHAYLEYLYSDDGQEIAARHHYRPRNLRIIGEYSNYFPLIEQLNIKDEFGGWQQAQKIHFSDGGTFDRLLSHEKSSALDNTKKVRAAAFGFLSEQ